MKESEFRKEMSRATGFAVNSRPVDAGVGIARQAGATFEPEMVELPLLNKKWARSLDAEERLEVLRRCLAVEEAAATIRANFASHGLMLNLRELLETLEGTK